MKRVQAPLDTTALLAQIQQWASELGFQQVGISDTQLSEHEAHLERWLDAGHHGDMDYMARHGHKRSRPDALEPGTCSVISVRMNYLPIEQGSIPETLEDPARAFVSRYALGRDYHKLMRKRLQTLAKQIQAAIGPFQYRAFVDSAPVLEKAIAQKAGLGWIGKHSNLIHRSVGSWFFLGEIYTDLPLKPQRPPEKNHCGACTRCLDICPTQAIVAPYQVDARRCVSYLTIELKGGIPEDLRPLIGNRIYGCDDCQWVCPWNRFAQLTDEGDFSPRNQLHTAELVELFQWDEANFLRNTEGSPIRRIGHAAWLRNIAVALGNSQGGKTVEDALSDKLTHPNEMVREHSTWALNRLRDQKSRGRSDSEKIR